jgi:hypothetical protein
LTKSNQDRKTGVTLAAKVFLTCNKDLLRPLFFKVLFTFLLVFRSLFFLIRTAKYPNEKMPNYLMDLPDNRNKTNQDRDLYSNLYLFRK